MAKHLQNDRFLFITVILLVFFGLLMVFSASASIQLAASRRPWAAIASAGTEGSRRVSDGSDMGCSLTALLEVAA